MRDPGVGFGKQFNLGLFDMDGMRSDGARTKDSKLIKALDNALLASFKAIFLIGLVLGDMDVEARS